MSILTKICVVILVLVALLACPVFITQATLIPDYRSALQKERQRSTRNLQQATHAELALRLANLQLDQLRRESKAQAGAARARESELLANEGALMTSIAGNQNTIESMTAERTNLQQLLSNVDGRAERLSQQAATARGKIDALTKETTRLSEMLTTSDSKLETAIRLARFQAERAADLDIKISKLEDELELLRVEGAVAIRKMREKPVPKDLIGTVVAVRGSMASINIGKAAGVKKGIKLLIRRGERFVGYLRVTLVDPDEAAGTLMDLQMPVERGDKVRSGFAVAVGG